MLYATRMVAAVLKQQLLGPNGRFQDLCDFLTAAKRTLLKIFKRSPNLVFAGKISRKIYKAKFT